MTAHIIDGQRIASAIRGDLHRAVAAMQARHGYSPGLSTVLVGDDPASATYVRMKQKACAELGIRSVPHVLPAMASQDEVEGLVASLSADPAINGILVQLPLPDHLNEEAILSAIDLAKDVDGFHPINIGRLAMKNRTPLFIPCTPFGIMRLLESTGIALTGAEAVIVGRSNIVGLPAAMLLKRADATVTLCHRFTRDLAHHTRQADIVVVAVGQAGLVTGDMLKPGAVVIDVGINRRPDASAPSGYRIVGDVDFESAAAVAGAITPVPGGVGPMTIAMLLHNTVRAAARAVADAEIAALLPGS